MRLRQFNVGCFGGGTGLPSLLGGLKNNPWLKVNAVVTMFDSGGSSGQLRDELGVQPPSVCAEYGDGSVTRGEVEVDAGQLSGRLVRRIWLEPPVSIHPAVAKAIGEFDAVIIGPGSFYTSLMPIFLVRGVSEALC